MPTNDVKGAARVSRYISPAVRRVLIDVLACAAALVIGVWMATVLVSRTVEVGPLTLEARISAGLPGATTVRVPPFGEVRADSHAGPLRLDVSVESVDVAAMQKLITGGGEGNLTGLAAGTAATVSDVIGAETQAAVRDLRWLAATTVLLATVVTAVVLLALRRRTRVVAIGSAVSLALLVAAIGLAGATFDPAAFASPRLEGPLSYIPGLQSVFAARVSSITQLRAQAAKAAENIASYYADPRSIASGGGLERTYRVLHVTDLHLDPVGAEFSRALARSYDASLVIDTGDIAIGGTAEETALLPSLVVTSTPVVYVPGNHDSPAVVDALSGLDNFTVATGGTVTVDGLTIVAVPDPASRSIDVEPDRDAVEEVTSDALKRLDALEAAGLPTPDVVALHDPSFERSLVGRVPLIVSGHTHSSRMYRHAETVRLNSGTTGGMPYDPVVTGRKRLPHSASILYYTLALPRRLIALDRLSVGVDGTTTLERTVIDESLLP